jgi:hypothetical protein
MISLAIGSVVVLAISTALYDLSKEQARANALLSLAEIQLSFQNALLRSSDWDQTKSQNPNMSCFAGKDPSDCSALASQPPQPLKLYSGGQLLYDAGNSQSGYDAHGAPCSTYGSSTDCIFKPLLNWHAECNFGIDPSCQSPLVVVNLTYTTTKNDYSSVNFASLGFSIANVPFALSSAGVCPAAPPASCPAGQEAICEQTGWTCREFGL